MSAGVCMCLALSNEEAFNNERFFTTLWRTCFCVGEMCLRLSVVQLYM